MPTSAELRSVLAPLLQLAPDAITADTTLRRFASSLERTKLELGLRRIGATLPTGPVGSRFIDLERQLGLGDASTLAATPAVSPIVGHATVASAGEADHQMAGLRVGIDIERIDAMPEVDDRWEDAFYAATFTPAELAAAAMRPDPRAHLCGAWCVKEALRKSSSSHTGLAMSAIQLRHAASGAPFVEVDQAGSWIRLPCAVSISHTDEIACAVVAWRAAEPESATLRTAPGRGAALPPSTARPSAAAMLLHTGALVVALAALIVALN